MARPLLYVAYPMRLDLSSANAIQTYNTFRELAKQLPAARLVVPRWLRERSAFEPLGAMHLPRPAINKLSRVVPWVGWSYIERTLYVILLVTLLVAWRLAGRGYRILYVRDTVCAAFLGLLAPLHGAKLVYEVHDLEAEHPSRAPRWPDAFWRRFLPWLDRAALTRACMVVSLTSTFRDWLVGRGWRAENRIAVIPDGFDPVVYKPQDRDTARLMLGLPPDSFIVAYAGLTFAYRRLDLLIEAFARVARCAEDAILVLVGGRPAEVEELRQLAGDLGVLDRLQFAGKTSTIVTARYLAAADVLVIPDTVTTLTASPLKLFEYMAVGRAIVCKDMPALREVLDEQSSVFFPAGDAEALAAALCGVKAQPARAAQMSAAALAKSSRYTYEARARRIEEVVARCQ